VSGDDPIVERVERALGHPGLIDALAALPPTDVTSFLLALARRRADAVTPAGLVRAHASNRLVQPSPLDPRALRACELRLLELVPAAFEIVNLAPVTPLGASHVLGKRRRTGSSPPVGTPRSSATRPSCWPSNAPHDDGSSARRLRCSCTTFGYSSPAGDTIPLGLDNALRIVEIRSATTESRLPLTAAPATGRSAGTRPSATDAR
jgi:hypothetical protein